MVLLPQDYREWVVEGHLAHHVSDLVDALDLSAFHALYDPRMMVKVLVYGYATDAFSSHKLARRLEEDVVFRFEYGEVDELAERTPELVGSGARETAPL